jgi:hypothetical protein
MGPLAALGRLSTGMLFPAIFAVLVALFIVVRLLFAAIALALMLAPLILVGVAAALIVRAIQKPKGAA